MATPRKHWFRVADSLAQEPLSNDDLATLIRLMGALNTRWARNGLNAEEACRIELGPAEVMLMSGKRRRDVAAKSLERLADIVSMSVERRGDIIAIHWPKWSEFQGLTTRTRGNPGTKPTRESPPPPPPPQDAPARRSSGGVTHAQDGLFKDRSKDPTTAAEQARAAWPAIRAAFAEYGKSLGEDIRGDRLKLITKRVSEKNGERELVAAVHGYVAEKGGLEPHADGWDPRDFFRPSTVFKEQGFSDRVDAGMGPRKPAPKRVTGKPPVARSVGEWENS